MAEDDGLPKVGKLNLDTVRNEQPLRSGKHDLDGNEIMESPRAASEQVLATPRSALDKVKQSFTIDAAENGDDLVRFQWQPGGLKLLATMGASSVLNIWDEGGVNKAAAQLNPTTTCKAEYLSRPPAWLQWDCSGQAVGVLKPGVGLWVCKLEGGSLSSIPLEQGEGTLNMTWAQWSRTVPQLLAVGSTSGKTMLYSSKTGKLVSQSKGKHPSTMKEQRAISCGEWLPDARLAVASGSRMKVSHPIDENCEWKSFSKFYTHRMQAKVPTKSVQSEKNQTYNPTPTCLAVSQGHPPYVAMNLGDKVMTAMDYTGHYKEEGFFIPLDYGAIVTFVWLPDEILLIGLSNGYVITVNVPLLMRLRKNPSSKAAEGAAAPTQKAMLTTRVFHGYLADLVISPDRQTPAVLGDQQVKILKIDAETWGQAEGTGQVQLSVQTEITVPFTPQLGKHLNSLSWGEGFISVGATNGCVYSFRL